MLRSLTFGLLAAGLVGVAGCTPNYSANTYSANAVQQANKVETAVVVGFRQVAISANGTVGAVTGGAAGGVLGSQSGTLGFNAALGAVGGSAIGSLLGSAVEHVTGDTKGWEYIVRKPGGEMLSVTQQDPTPLALGQKVLVISGNQARIIPDYSVPAEPAAEAAPASGPATAKPKDDEAPVVKEPQAPASIPAPIAAPIAVPAPTPAEPAASATPDPFMPMPIPAEPAAPPA